MFKQYIFFIGNEQMDHLTEPGIRSYLFKTLEECKQIKYTYYTTIMNVVLFVAFLAVMGCTLYFKKKTKMTPDERKKRNEEDRMHVVNRIRSLQLEKITTHKLI